MSVSLLVWIVHSNGCINASGNQHLILAKDDVARFGSHSEIGRIARLKDGATLVAEVPREAVDDRYSCAIEGFTNLSLTKSNQLIKRDSSGIQIGIIGIKA